MVVNLLFSRHSLYRVRISSMLQNACACDRLWAWSCSLKRVYKITPDSQLLEYILERLSTLDTMQKIGVWKWVVIYGNRRVVGYVWQLTLVFDSCEALFVVQERTRNTQFIIISLRNNMFELADRLIGIYKTYNCTKSVAINPNSFAFHDASTLA